MLSLPSIKLPTASAAVRQIMDGDYISRNLIQQSYLRHLANEEEARQDNYTKYREYYDGIHDTMLTARQKAFLQLKDGQEFNDNYCPIVVDALAERLKVTGFDAGETTQGETLWGWWRDSRMDGLQGIVHTAAVRDGDAFVMVEWDNIEGRPIYTFELSCSGGEGVKVHYSKERKGRIEFASKRWKIGYGGESGKATRLNLYFDNHVEKYIAEESTYEGNWRPWLDDDTGDISAPGVYGECGWIWWTDNRTAGGKPLGIPVVHFKNKDQGYDHGQSELEDVIPLQNALNKSIIDLLASADVSAFRVLFAKGKNWTGLNIFPGSVVSSEDPQSDLRAIPGEDPAPLLAVVDKFSMEIARVSRTPLSYFQANGSRPAEGTLQQEESGLVAKADKCCTDFGNAWEELMKVSRRMANAFGSAGLDEKQRIETQWKERQTRNELQHLQVLEAKQRLGVPAETIWREMGYNDEEIRQFKVIKLKAQQLALRQQLMVPALPSGQPVATGGADAKQPDQPASGQPAGTGQPAATAA
jgi:hypothetical protein